MAEVSPIMQPFTMAASIAEAVGHIISEIAHQLPPAPPPPPPAPPSEAFVTGVLDGNNNLQLGQQSSHNVIIPEGCNTVQFEESSVTHAVKLYLPPGGAAVSLTAASGLLSQDTILPGELLVFYPVPGHLLGWIC